MNLNESADVIYSADGWPFDTLGWAIGWECYEITVTPDRQYAFAPGFGWSVCQALKAAS